MRFERKENLNSRYIDPFQVVQRVDLTYKLDFPLLEFTLYYLFDVKEVSLEWILCDSMRFMLLNNNLIVDEEWITLYVRKVWKMTSKEVILVKVQRKDWRGYLEVWDGHVDQISSLVLSVQLF